MVGTIRRYRKGFGTPKCQPVRRTWPCSPCPCARRRTETAQAPVPVRSGRTSAAAALPGRRTAKIRTPSPTRKPMAA